MRTRQDPADVIRAAMMLAATRENQKPVLTHEVAERNYGGRDTRDWIRVVTPLNFGDPAPSVPVAPLARRP